MAEKRKCRSCGKEYDITEFYHDRRLPSKRMSRCRHCQLPYQHEVIRKREERNEQRRKKLFSFLY